jgi:hypothetical protein
MRPESAIQREVRHALAKAGFASVHVPNGAVLAGDAQRRARQMNALKADGLYPGFPDLLVYAGNGRIGHIEIKTPTGPIQETQHRCRAWLESLGHKYAICRDKDEVCSILIEWGWLK